MTEPDTQKTIHEREQRRFSVSSNRSEANHRVLYVEVGGALVDNEACSLCQIVPSCSDQLKKEEDPDLSGTGTLS
ncbi:hypothetical protein BGK46_11095 [Salinivibrio sp. SS2]|nr:hypothetical protein BGK46_11095 [Salinivibrio sp. DV]